MLEYAPCGRTASPRLRCSGRERLRLTQLCSCLYYDLAPLCSCLTQSRGRKKSRVQSMAWKEPCLSRTRMICQSDQEHRSAGKTLELMMVNIHKDFEVCQGEHMLARPIERCRIASHLSIIVKAVLTQVPERTSRIPQLFTLLLRMATSILTVLVDVVQAASDAVHILPTT